PAVPHALSWASLFSRVKFWPELLLAGPGMFLLHQMTHWPGSGVGTCAYIATWNVPFGSHSPNSVPALVLAVFSSNPASFHWLWRSCSTSSRALLPAVVLIVRLAR